MINTIKMSRDREILIEIEKRKEGKRKKNMGRRLFIKMNGVTEWSRDLKRLNYSNVLAQDGHIEH